jgi:NCAIR mutase (PurE)-related protein
LKYKAIADRKEKKLAELKSSLDEKKPQEKETNKQSNTEGLTREEVIFYAKGYEEDDYKVAKIIAQEKGITLTEAMKDEYFQLLQDKKRQKENDKKASLPPSNATGITPKKDPEKMTRDEHKAWYEEQIAKAMNS